MSTLLRRGGDTWKGSFGGWRHLKRDFGGVAVVERGFEEERKRNEERNRGRWWI